MNFIGSEVAPLKVVLVKNVQSAFVNQNVIDLQWKNLNFTAPPDFSRALREYDGFLELIANAGATLMELPKCADVTLDSIFTRDASIVSSGGIILCSMGKRERSAEPTAQEAELKARQWPVAGRITLPGLLEGGDLVWLDSRTIAVGQGYRTNAEGIRQLRLLLKDSVDQLLVVPLPHWRGPSDVMHLMSLISPIDTNLAVVYSRLLPVMFREELLRRAYQLIEVPDEEFVTLGTNVLTVAPRVCVMVKGNPQTRARLERAGTTVFEYEGNEISLKGGGGPTCLTRPLARSA